MILFFLLLDAQDMSSQNLKTLVVLKNRDYRDKPKDLEVAPSHRKLWFAQGKQNKKVSVSEPKDHSEKYEIVSRGIETIEPASISSESIMSKTWYRYRLHPFKLSEYCSLQLTYLLGFWVVPKHAFPLSSCRLEANICILVHWGARMDWIQECQ